MAYGGYTYFDTKYVPAKDDFVVLIWARGNAPIEKIAEGIASESSVGTWTKLKTMNQFVWEHLRARVFKIHKLGKNAGFIWIAYPYEHFDSKNVMQFCASVMGNIFGLKELEELYVCDIKFPLKYQKQFPGPKAGMEGIRKYVGTDKSRRPHTGTIPKPKVGLNPKEFAHVAYESWIGGLDFVKDDENLVDQKFCPFKERFHEVVKAAERVERETGRKVLYSPNITDRYDRMMDRMDYVKAHGWPMVMMDVYLMGFSVLPKALEQAHKYNLFTHAHRAGYAAAHRGNYGANFIIYEKYYRMLGVDQLHIGTGVGKMEGGPLLIKRLHQVADERKGPAKMYLGMLDFEWAPHIKPIFSVSSGGMDAGKVEASVALHGKDVIVQAGGGIHGHPLGTRGGAASMRQAVEAVMKGISLPVYAKTHKELKMALDKFGYVSPKEVLKELAHEKKNWRKMDAEVLRQGRKGMEKYS